jgi:tetratricopeptide (TPR) repeat protein/transglutaminase-like putative cysteine protease
MSSKQFIALLFAGIALSYACAQDKEKPGAKLSAPGPDFSKEAYVIDRISTRIRAENDGTDTREVTAEVKVLAEAGVKALAILNFTYTSANEVVEIDYVRVRKPDGMIVKTPDFNIQDMPGEVTRSAPLYSDIHEKHVAVKGLAVGDVLEYLVRYRVVKPEVPGQFWYEYSFTKLAISKDERLEISIPSGKYAKIVSPEFKPEITEESGRKIYRWTYSNLSIKVKEPGEIPRRIPPNPDVQLTTFAGWEDVGRWYGELQKGPLQVTPAIQAKAVELTTGLKTDDEKIHAIYNFVALKFHYVGLDFGIGRYQPHAADDVLDNGYGDCKDKHTLLAALLKAAGIEAWPALIHTTRQLDPDVPSPAQFNHVISVVPQGDHFLWLDTTPEVAPYGLLLRPLRDKQALVIPVNQGSRLAKTPENPPHPQRQDFTMEGKINTDGVFTGHATQFYVGDVAVQMRALFRAVPESQWKETMQRISYSLSFAGDVSNVKVSPADEIDNPFIASYDYERKNFGDWENHRTISALPPMGVEVTKDSKDMMPEEPVQLGALGKINYISRMRLPEGYQPELPAPLHLSEPYATYDATPKFEDGVLTITRQFEIKKTEVALSEWKEFRKFGRTINDDEYFFIPLNLSGGIAEKKTGGDGKRNDPLATDAQEMFRAPSGAVDDMFKEGSYALQQRDFQRAQELFEKVIAKDPHYKGAHFNLAISLASRNNVSSAMEEFRKEEKVSPEDPRPYQAVAGFLTYSGRHDEAATEWRKLLQADPDNRTAVAALAALLYQSEKYAEAVGVLEKAVKSAPDSSSLRLQLGETYLKTAQNEKAVVEFKEAIKEKGDDPDTLNTVAFMLAERKISLDIARQYAETAVDKLYEQARDPESSPEAGMRITFELSLVWDTLGWIYYRQGDFKRAEDLVRPAWLLGEESVVAEHLGEVYEREGKLQQAARAYESALAASSTPASAIGMRADAAKAYGKRSEDIRLRYKKLTGKEPPRTEIRRLPNGEWTKTPAEQLRHTRELNLSNEGKLSGSGQFIVTLKPGKVEGAEQLTGSDGLSKIVGKLMAAHYPLEFPPDANAVLVMKVDVRCQTSGPCVGTLVNPSPPAAQFGSIN